MFLGVEKAKEFKSLFSAWIHKIYRVSYFHDISFKPPLISPTAPTDWHLYTLDQPAPNDPSTHSVEQDEDDSRANADPNADANSGTNTNTNAGTNPQQPPVVASTTPSQPAIAYPAVLSKTDATDNDFLPLDLPLPTNSHPNSPTEVPSHAAAAGQGQDSRNFVASTYPDCHVPSRGSGLLTTIDNLPTDATEPIWMKAKETLKYFRGVHKMGKLLDLILHWYQLEEVLGFQETVSCLLPKHQKSY